MMIAGRRLSPRTAPLPRGNDGRGDGAARPGPEGAYRWCRRMVRERDPAIYALTALMPRLLWPGCWALWAALAAVDDIADSRTRHPTERAVELQAWVNALDAELATETSTDMVAGPWSTPSCGGDSTWLTYGPRSRFLPATCIPPPS